MTIVDLLRYAHEWATAHALDLLLASLIAPVLGTVAAFAGKLGRTDADGRFIADGVLFLAIALLLLTTLDVLVAHTLLGQSLLDLDAMLVAAPLAALALSLGGTRLVFRFEQLAVVRVVRDLALFLVACAFLAWIGHKFRGWGVLFVGSALQLFAFAVLAFFLLARLWRNIGRGPAKEDA